jgi:hypothetical protein
MCGVPTERFVLSDDEVNGAQHVIHALALRDDFEQLVPEAADRQAVHNLLSLLEREDKVVLSVDYQQRLQQPPARILPESG